MDSLYTQHSDLEFALEVAHADSWEMDLSKGTLTFSTRWVKYLGYEPGEVAQTMEAVQSLIHPDDLQRSFDDLQAYVSGKTDTYQTECRLRKKNGQFIWLLSRGKAVVWNDDGVPQKLIGTNFNITERKTYELEKEATLELLKLLHADNNFHELLELVSKVMLKWSGCEAVGIRLNDGKDFPYYETKGFPDDFVLTERPLCVFDENTDVVCDEIGNAAPECLCGNIFNGRFDPSLPVFTPNGSFWTNNTSDLLASTSDKDRPARTRKRFHGEGYESVALVPLKTRSDVFGLIQFNDSARDKFTARDIELYERLASSIALGLSQRKTVQEVHKKERTTRAILDASQAVIVLLDHDGTIVECNKAMLDRFQKTSGELIGSCVWNLFPPDISEKRKALLDQVFQTGEQGQIEDCRNGICSEASVYPVFDDTGTITHVTVSAVDITDRRNADEALKKSEAENRAILNAVPDLMLVLSEDGVHLDYYAHEPENLYATPENFLGKSVDKVLPPEVSKKYQNSIKKTIRSSKIQLFEYALDFPDGQRHFDCRMVLHREHSVLAIVRDITQRKHTELLIKENDERLQQRNMFIETILDNLPIGLAVNNVSDQKALYLNENFTSIYGWPKDCLDSVERFFECVYPDPEYRREIVSQIVADIQSGDPDRMVWPDIQITTQDGSKKYVAARNIPIPEQNLMISTVIDVTSRKRAEEALRVSEERYKALYDNAPLSYQSLDENGCFLDVNPTWLKTLGYRREEVIGTCIKEFLHPEWQPHFEKNFPAFKKRGFVHDVHYRIRHKNGQYRDISFEGCVGYHPDGTVRQTYCVFQDITDQKHAEETIADMNLRLQETIQAGNVGLWDWDILTNNVIYSREWKKQIGYGENEITNSIEEWKSRVHENDRDAVIEQIQACISEARQNDQVRFRFRHKDGHYLWILAQASVMQDETGRSVRMRGSHIDITESMRIEEALSANETTYRTLIEALPDIVMRFDRDGKLLFVSENVATFVSIDPSTFIGKTHRELNFPEDYCTHCEGAIDRVFESGTPYEAEFTINGTKGETVFNWRLQPEFDEQGAVRSVLSISRDVTAHRQAEQNYQMLFREMLDGFALHEIICDENGKPFDYRFLAFNPAFERITGLNKDELLGRTVLEVFPDTEQSWIDTYGTVALTGEPAFFKNLHTDFGTYYQVTAFQPMTRQFACIFTDVTERTKAEKALQESEERFRRYFELGLVGMAITSLDKGWIEFNDTLRDMFGYSHDEFVKLTWSEMTHPDDLELDLGLFNSVLNGERNGYSIEKRFIHKNGTVRTTELSVNAIRKDDGSVDYFLALIHDITERKQAEQDLLRQQRIISLNNQIAQVFLTSPSENIYADVLNVVLEALESTFGLFGYIDDAGSLVCPSMTRTEREQSEIEDENIVFTHATWEGFWGESLREKKTVIRNTSLQLPGGHMPMANAMAVAIVHHDKLIGQFVVGDKTGGYNQYDRELLENVASQTAPVLYSLLENAHQKLEHEKLEEQFRQAQKMEAVGRLAGGVAHDFNNMLGVILGNADLAMRELDESSSTFEDLQEIQKAAQRSSNLTRQLLAFARKQTIMPQVLDLNDTIEGMLKMLRRLIGEDIDLIWEPGDDVWPVKMDPGQLDQILANLCVNARDAITDIGSVVIETEKMVFDAQYCEDHTGAKPGDYVMLAISDNGHGMDTETLAKAFEPFFTTKKTSDGTGLGLATVYGIIKQNDGFINLYSEPGMGTTIKIYLPQYVGKSVRHTETAAEQSTEKGHETVLLVEDEKSLLRLGIKTLQLMGYNVLAAESPGEAIELATSHSGFIDLLLTDVVMPEMNGRELAKRIIAMYPDIKCLFMSGYTANVIAHRGVLDKGVHFLQKPYSRTVLGKKVRDLLDEDA